MKDTTTEVEVCEVKVFECIGRDEETYLNVVETWKQLSEGEARCKRPVTVFATWE